MMWFPFKSSWDSFEIDFPNHLATFSLYGAQDDASNNGPSANPMLSPKPFKA